MKKIIYHIIPTQSTGGVEIAAKTTINLKHKKFDFNVYPLSKPKSNKKVKNDYKLIISYIKSFFHLWDKEPSIIIASLWKSNLIALFLILFKRKIKLILFLHSTNNVHILDSIITNIAALISDEIWGDSKETLKKRLSKLIFTKKKYKTRVISFRTSRYQPIAISYCSPTFIYWGRLSSEKRIDKSINFFKEIYKKYATATFTIIGEDFGEKRKLLKLINNLNLEDNIKIYEAMEIEYIIKYVENCSFFLQLSDFEGMGMSIVESMQLGLIPITTNVGEVKSYCSDLVNSIIYDNNENVKSKVLDLITNIEKYNKIKENSIRTWSSQSIYKEDIINACLNLL